MIITLGLIYLYGLINTVLHPVAVIASASAAGDQFAASDTTYVLSVLRMDFFKSIGIPFVVLVGLLVWVWWPKKKTVVSASLIVLLACTFIHPSKAYAYFSDSDKTEAYTILPNESAFWIPDTGNNKSSQAQFDSVSYLESNKIPVKRFVIPHHKLDGSGGFIGVDRYVPDGRLIIVDRTTYSREWVGSATKGSSSSDQSISCQGTDGINVQTGIAIGASVPQENAALYLYRFGVKAPAGSREDPNVIFTSVYYSRSLAEVMDDVGRKQIQALVCKEFAKRNFTEINRDSNIIMDSVVKSVTESFAKNGITMYFLGWSGSFQFDADVQKAINDRYVATTLQSSVPTLQALADIRVKEGVGQGLATHGLPANLISAPEGQLQGVGLGPLLDTNKK